MWLIILIRLIFPLAIFKQPLAGGILAILWDYFDLELINTFDPHNIKYYQSVDKLLDAYYLSIEAYVFTRTKNKLVKVTALALFFYRLIGMAAFEITQSKELLVIFPNTFEYIYLIYLTQLKLFKKDLLEKRYLFLISLFLIISTKVFHEYLLHINKVHPWSVNKYVKMIIDPDFNRFVDTIK